MTETEIQLLISVAAQSQALLTLSRYNYIAFTGHLQSYHGSDPNVLHQHLKTSFSDFQKTVLSHVDYGDASLNERVRKLTELILKDFVETMK